MDAQAEGRQAAFVGFTSKNQQNTAAHLD